MTLAAAAEHSSLKKQLNAFISECQEEDDDEKSSSSSSSPPPPEKVAGGFSEDSKRLVMNCAQYITFNKNPWIILKAKDQERLCKHMENTFTILNNAKDDRIDD